MSISAARVARDWVPPAFAEESSQVSAALASGVRAAQERVLAPVNAMEHQASLEAEDEAQDRLARAVVRDEDEAADKQYLANMNALDRVEAAHDRSLLEESEAVRTERSVSQEAHAFDLDSAKLAGTQRARAYPERDELELAESGADAEEAQADEDMFVELSAAELSESEDKAVENDIAHDAELEAEHDHDVRLENAEDDADVDEHDREMDFIRAGLREADWEQKVTQPNA